MRHGLYIYVWHVSLIFLRWLLHTIETTHSYIRRDSLIHVWHVLFINTTWLIHTCNTTHSYKQHDSFIQATWLIQISCVQAVCLFGSTIHEFRDLGNAWETCWQLFLGVTDKEVCTYYDLIVMRTSQTHLHLNITKVHSVWETCWQLCQGVLLRRRYVSVIKSCWCIHHERLFI